jgi:anti-sigma B factor antagonist
MTSQEADRMGDGGPGLSVRWEGDDRALVLSGELDLATAHILQSALDQHGGSDGDLTLDLAGLDFMDSTGIKLIITAARTLEGRGCLILRSPAAPIQRVLELVQIDRVPGVKVESLE